MKKRRLDLKPIGKEIINTNLFSISKNGNEYIFKIGNEFTHDVAEATAILMRMIDYNDEVWNIEVSNINLDEITPSKALFWLTGGYSEWRDLENYNKPWSHCYLDFQEEFGYLIINIVEKSKKLKDIRDLFIKNVNLPILYDFALSKNMI